ncbi:MAG: flagellar assembly peptidoglycan hydrolase FlgJ [Gammaproteobacteria bacterium]|nr:flagellar assembly peptidoglycan hydrolase FlgJ [Gammaproteobacteria bacterium]
MQTPTASAYTDFHRFSALRTEASKDPQAALKKVAKEFEAMFVQLMLQSARNATPQDGVFESNETGLYREMFDNQIALSVAERGALGFAELLQRQVPQAAAANDGPVTLKLPERRLFPSAPLHYTPIPEPDTNDEVVDVTTWQARVTNRGFAEQQQKFTASLLAGASGAAKRLGTTPEILVAQAALETGWGQHVMHTAGGQSSHNLFGIKADGAWNGETVKRRTLEYFNGNPVQVNAAFRAYPDPAAAFDDYANFIQTNPRYAQALERAADPKAYIQELQRAGYATDPNYAQKILRLHDQIATHVAQPDRG